MIVQCALLKCNTIQRQFPFLHTNITVQMRPSGGQLGLIPYLWQMLLIPKLTPIIPPVTQIKLNSIMTSLYQFNTRVLAATGWIKIQNKIQ